jgi:hypothetical protein
MKHKFILFSTVLAILLSSCSVYEWAFKKRKTEPIIALPISSKQDSSSAKSKLKPYKTIITANVRSQKGLIIVHNIGEKVFFEITDSILNKDILIVNRIIKGPNIRVKENMFGYAGDEIGKNLVRFERGPNNKFFVRQLAYANRSADSTENGLFKSFQKSNLNPIIASFDITSISPDSSGLVIDMTDFIKGDNVLFGFDAVNKQDFKIGPLQVDKSYILGINSFEKNTEIKTVKTFTVAALPYTYELNSSIVLLPTIPMRPRQADGRVGFFGVVFADYDRNSQKIENTEFINKWRLEPKPEDAEKYSRGELVVPAKPIVYYIDPATPKKWVKYLIQGVNDWQKAFEKAGFKNAIYALEAPKNDPDWSLEDVRHNVIVYKPSTVANAMGPHIEDPRTGEILESHIHWYHGIMSLLHDWYMVQAGPNDPRARKPVFDDELMGTLIRFASSHEVGHTLGLAHNFVASKSVLVEKLRNKVWVEENGFCPSIMDYARFNYVAQPEDHISEKGLMPRIGVYDEWAIEWGYKLQPEFKNLEEERLYNNNLVIERTSKDKRLLFVAEGNAGSNVQTEDIGDDAMKASSYGIKNLKLVMASLPDWVNEPGKTRWDYKLTRDEVTKQFSRYIGHVYNNLRGMELIYKTSDQPGPLWKLNSKTTKKQAVEWLNAQVFNTPTWLLNKEFYGTVLPGGTGNSGEIITLQSSVLDGLLNIGIFASLSKAEELYPINAYRLEEYLNDLKNGIWSELIVRNPIDRYRRNLQKAYIFRLGYLLVPAGNIFDPKDPSQFAQSYRFMSSTDIYARLKTHAEDLLAEIKKARMVYKDKNSVVHLKQVEELLQMALRGKLNTGISTMASPVATAAPATGTGPGIFSGNADPFAIPIMNDRYGCFDLMLTDINPTKPN